MNPDPHHVNRDLAARPLAERAKSAMADGNEQEARELWTQALAALESQGWPQIANDDDSDVPAL